MIEIANSSVLLLMPLVALVVVMFSNSYLRGCDAYYYALQCDWLVKHDSLRIPDISVVFSIMALFQHMGLNSESAVKLWACLSIGFAWLVGFTYLRRNISGVLLIPLGLWFTFSPSLVFLSIEFPKMSILPALFTLAFMYASKEKWGRAVFCMVVGVLFHRSAIVYVILMAGVMLSTKPFHRKIMNRRQWMLIVIGSLGFFGWVLVHYSVLDLGRLVGNNYEPGILTLLKRDALPWPIKTELYLSVIALIGTAFYASISKKQAGKMWFPFVLLIPSVFPLGIDDVMSAGERFALFFPWISLNGILFLMSDVKMGVMAERRTIVRLGIVGASVSLTLMFPRWLEECHPRSLDPDYPVFSRITNVLKDREIPMLVCRKDYHFFYKYKTGRDAFSYEPEAHWDKKRIWRLVYGVRWDELMARMDCDRNDQEWGPIQLPGDKYLLLREDAWDEYRNKVHWEDDSTLFHLVKESWLNPSQPRPAFLYGKHKDDPKTEFDALKM
jgi:hypothetical protein